MRAIVLSAGQGKRLLPLTADLPKCLLPVSEDCAVLEFQLAALARCGVRHATVVIGFGAGRVESFLAEHPPRGLQVETFYNPFYESSDNLATCWLVRERMEGGCLLLNGDTIFEDRVLARLLEAEDAPITVTIDRKPDYDDDDMKVVVTPTGRLEAIGKKLPRERVNGESIGLLRFSAEGARLFARALDCAIRSPEGLRSWYLSVVNEIAREREVRTCAVEGAWWREIDSPGDLEETRRSLRDAGERALPRAAAAIG